MKSALGFWREFRKDERGDAIKSISLMSFGIAMASMAGANLLDRATRDGGIALGISGSDSAKYQRATAGLPRAVGPAAPANQQVTVDYSPTGSIPANLARPIVLDPCTGIRK